MTAQPYNRTKPAPTEERAIAFVYPEQAGSWVATWRIYPDWRVFTLPCRSKDEARAQVTRWMDIVEGGLT